MNEKDTQYDILNKANNHFEKEKFEEAKNEYLKIKKYYQCVF